MTGGAQLRHLALACVPDGGVVGRPFRVYLVGCAWCDAESFLGCVDAVTETLRGVEGAIFRRVARAPDE